MYVTTLYPVSSLLLQHEIEIEVDGHVRNVKGTVFALLADTLAAHQLEGFKVGETPEDMHVLFEGVLRLEIRLMLKHFLVNEGYFTLETFNSHMESFA